MARNYETASSELENAKAELEALSTISNEEACYIYNVDSKSEIVDAIREEIEALEKEAECLILDNLYDPAVEIFGSHEAMNSFLY